MPTLSPTRPVCSCSTHPFAPTHLALEKKKLSIVYPHPVRSRSPGDPPVHLPPSPFAPTRPLTARLSPSHFTPPGRLYHVAHPTRLRLLSPPDRAHPSRTRKNDQVLFTPTQFFRAHPPTRSSATRPICAETQGKKIANSPPPPHSSPPP